MTTPAAARPAEARRGTRRQGRSSQRSSQRSIEGGYDRVGGSRLTGVGAILVGVVVVGAMSPPATSDPGLAALVWAVFVVVLLVGVAAPLVLVRRIRVTATAPRDAVVGDRVPVEVELAGRCAGFEIRTLDPTGPWTRAEAPASGAVVHLADRRGLFHALRVEVRVTAPLGILAAHKVHWIDLPHAVEVAPRPLPMRWSPRPAPIEAGAHHVTRTDPSGDLVRSVRPYVSGDPPHLVHWPTTARMGELVVRELEPPAPVGSAVVVDLTNLGALTEQAASYAMGACRAVLGAGGELVLCTCEAGGPVSERVRYPIDAARRLARAVPGRPGEPPDGWPVARVGADQR
ncbi:MAG: DUF58 domain-containing protein [Actinobacteria bacterium]|nr:DUF58 domain-containing protein [Actinomycetota bacterium]